MRKNSKRYIHNRQQARRLAKQYNIEQSLALKVVNKECSLLEAIQENKRLEEALRLKERYGLSQMQIQSVQSGQMALEEILITQGYKEHLLHSDQNPYLVENTVVHVWGHGLKKYAGLVSAVEQYSISLDVGGETQQIPKLHIKAFCIDDDSFPVSWNEELQVPTEPIHRIEDRFRISSKRLYSLVYHQNRLRLTLLEGLVVEGCLFFAGRYECGIRTDSGQEIIVMRHAFHSLIVL